MKGPLTVGEYMKEALGNPKWGYYMKNDVFGSKGDFITSPEVSQMFGELIGVWFLNEWLNLKTLYGDDLPKTVQFVELGPGRGTLMKDVLKVWRKCGEAASDLNVYMVESSPFMRRTQLKTLCDLGEDIEPTLLEAYQSKHSINIKIIWLQDLSQLPRLEAPQFFLANEFFDALPIQKFQKTPEGYRELLVDVSEEEVGLQMKISKSKTIGTNFILKLYPNYEAHEHLEISVDSARNIELISNRISEMNGSMLLIDYGHEGQCTDTFRAFKEHKLIPNVFKMPGQCDLTADVDFAFLKHIAKNSNVFCYGPTSQEKFLNQMQISSRLKMLLEKCESSEERRKLVDDVSMLTDTKKMGERFKMMAIRKFDFQTPPGFMEEKELDI